jgi:hypothetical protein
MLMPPRALSLVSREIGGRAMASMLLFVITFRKRRLLLKRLLQLKITRLTDRKENKIFRPMTGRSVYWIFEMPSR